jgi:hypothetical protein
VDVERGVQKAGRGGGDSERERIKDYLSQKAIEVGDKLSHPKLMHGREEVFVDCFVNKGNLGREKCCMRVGRVS